MIDRARLHEEIGIELGDLFAGDRLDLGIAEWVRSLGQGDDEGLIRKIDPDHGELESPFGLERRIGPVLPRDGAIIIPSHEILVLDTLGIEWRKEGGRLSSFDRRP